MAKIKVESQSTGTGIYTLKTGAASTNYSATLPDATGTLLMTDGDGSSLSGLSHTPEGTAVVSTGETGATKFLREDGDGTCSWQAAAGGGKVLQVVQGSTDIVATINTTTLVSIGLTVNITPQTGSKVLVMYGTPVGLTVAGTSAAIKLYKGSASIYRSWVYGGYDASSSDHQDWVAGNYLDESVGGDGSTAITYTVYSKRQGGTGNCNFQSNSSTGTIIAIEIGT